LAEPAPAPLAAPGAAGDVTMRLHDRLVLRLCLKVLVFSACGWVILWILIDLFEKMDNFVDHQAQVDQIARFYLFLIPEILRQTLPVDVLLASMFTLSVLAKNNELVALLAGGVSLFRIARPILFVALVVTGFSALLGEKIVPDSNARMRRVRRVEIEKQAPADAPVRYGVTYRGESGYLYHIDVLDTQAETMKGVEVHRYEGGRVVARVLARSATWRGDAWEFHQGFYRTFSRAGADTTGLGRETVQEFANRRMPELLDTPRDLARLQPEPDEMTYRALQRQIERAGTSGASVSDPLVELHLKRSSPWTSLILAGLGVGLSSRKRKSSLVAGFGVTLVIGFGYLILTQMAAALGKNEQIPPLLAAWMGQIVFGAAAAVVLSRANR
jgi:lipopolysaccharide export system permease protein